MTLPSGPWSSWAVAARREREERLAVRVDGRLNMGHQSDGCANQNSSAR